MGKSGRHKKLNRQDKAKTQLKGAKKLAKAQNVVNPTLKVRKIVIREQLHEEGLDEGGELIPTTRRKQTLQELLSLVQHHNTNLKKDAVQGLLELITGQGTVIKGNLQGILERVAMLTGDLDSGVRKENLKLAEAVFQRIDETDLRPFFVLILTHLQCSLTHLNPSIRYGTLPMFHLLIAHFPTLVATSAPTVLSSLLGLISSGGGGNGTTNNTTHLKVEVSQGRNLNQVEERIKVFQLIEACFQLKREEVQTRMERESVTDIVFGRRKEETPVVLVSPEESDGVMIFTPAVGPKHTTEEDPFRVPLVYPFGYDDMFSGSSQTRSLSLHQILGSVDSASSPSDGDSEFWSCFTSSCLSCLIETWIEIGTGSDKGEQRKQGGGPFPLSHAAVPILQTLVAVMIQIVTSRNGKGGNKDNTMGDEDGGHQDFDQRTKNELRKHFFSKLPFISVHDKDKESLTTVNLQLYLLAGIAGFFSSDKDLCARMEQYINDLMDSSTSRSLSLDWTQIELILNILRIRMRSRTYRIQSSEDSLSTIFICWILSNKNHRREMCKYLLQRVLQPKDSGDEHADPLLNSLDWNSVTPKLMNSFSRISTKWLNLLTHIAIKQLSDVKGQLMRKMPWFQSQLQSSDSVSLWNESLRLFWYADAIHEFKESFGKLLPENGIQTLDALLARTEEGKYLD